MRSFIQEQNIRGSIYSNKNSLQEQLTSQCSHIQFQEDPLRIRVMLIYSFLCSFSAMSWLIFSPIQKEMMNIYGISEIEITFCSLIFIILYIPINFPCNYIMDEYGISVGLSIGAFLQFLGSLIRLLINKNFYYVVIAQILCACSQPFLLNAPAKIAATWFNQDNRAMATTILSIVFPLASALGYLLPIIFVSANCDQDSGRRQVYNLIVCHAILGFIMNIVVVFIKDKPKCPPSFSANQEKTKFSQSFKRLFKNGNYLRLALSFGIMLGIYSFIAMEIELILNPFGFTSNQISIFGGILTISGITGSAIFGYMLKKTKKYKKLTLICQLMQMTVLIPFYYGTYYQNYLIMTFVIFFFGFFTTPLIPLCLEFNCEITFPIGEAMVMINKNLSSNDNEKIIKQFTNLLQNQNNQIQINGLTMLKTRFQLKTLQPFKQVKLSKKQQLIQIVYHCNIKQQFYNFQQLFINHQEYWMFNDKWLIFHYNICIFFN